MKRIGSRKNPFRRKPRRGWDKRVAARTAKAVRIALKQFEKKGSPLTYDELSEIARRENLEGNVLTGEIIRNHGHVLKS